MSETPRIPRVLNPEAIGDPEQTPVVQLPMSETETRARATLKSTLRADLTEARAELARLRGVVEAVQALADDWAERVPQFPADAAIVGCGTRLRAVLAPVSSSGEAESGACPRCGARCSEPTQTSAGGVCGHEPPVPSGGPVVSAQTARCLAGDHEHYVGSLDGYLFDQCRHCYRLNGILGPVSSGGQADGEGEVTRALMEAMGCKRVPSVGALAVPFYDFCERHTRSLGYGDWDVHRRECPEARRLAGVSLAARPVLSREALADANDALHKLSAWIDAGNAHRDPEAITWGRLAKITEEAGEAIAAYIGCTGQNPRKGVTHSVNDVQEELLDVAVTALGAVAHLHGNDGEDVLALLRSKIERVAERALQADVLADVLAGEPRG